MELSTKRSQVTTEKVFFHRLVGSGAYHIHPNLSQSACLPIHLQNPSTDQGAVRSLLRTLHSTSRTEGIHKNVYKINTR